MDNARVEPSLFFIEKTSFSLKLFSGHFYGQSFIKTVRGPYPFQYRDVPGVYKICSLEVQVIINSVDFTGNYSGI